MNQISVRTISAILVLALLAAFAAGAGIRVSPGTMLLHDTPVGETFDFAKERGQSIRIGPVERVMTYALHPEPASEGGTQATGYYDFPDASWFSISVDTVSIEKGGVAEIPMWLEIPDDEGYYNHHWLLGIPVSPISGEGGMQLQVGGYLLFRFETESREGVVPRCADNEVVAVPSIVRESEVTAGDTRELVVDLFSGAEKAGIYTVERLDPASEVAEYTILGRPGYPRLSNPEWIEYPDTVVIPGREEGSGPLPITINIPPDARFRRFEEILLLKGGYTRPAFIRIQVIMKQL